MYTHLYKSIINLYSITDISVSDWVGGLCNDNTAVITFLAPVNDDFPFFGGLDSFSNIEALGMTVMMIMIMIF
jgi:hypothetical protein